ncbi:MAG: tetratricopeptide repeat protein, partial [Thermoplasmata archaeon]|nr:tetratricopeptide repeat protein [Thermoplasmata archaeon]
GGPIIPYVPSYPEPREPTPEDRASAWHILGRTEMVAGDLSAAHDHLSEAASMVPDLPRLQLDLGNALRETGDIKGALAAFRLAEDHDLDDESPRALSGVCHLQLGDAKAAERAFDSAIGISPDYALAWLGKGLALMTRGRDKKAVRYIREALRLDPQFTEARLSLAEAYGRLGRTAEAKREARSAYALDPEAEEARRQLEAIGAKPPAPPSPVPKAEPEGPAQLTTRPPQVPKGEAQAGSAAPRVPVREEDLEEIPSPGPELDKWFSEHQEWRRPPTDE